MSLLRVNRIHWASLGIRMVYGPHNLPPEQLKKINYFRAIQPGDFRYLPYRHLLHVNLDEIINEYARAEDPYPR